MSYVETGWLKQVGRWKDRVLTRAAIMLILLECVLLVAWILIKIQMQTLRASSGRVFRYWLTGFYRLMGLSK